MREEELVKRKLTVKGGRAGSRFFARSDGFRLDGSPFFIYSAEMHYFRLAPELWERHIRLAKEANINTISTYIPWDWHEYEEGRFDFRGKTDPRRNLVHFIELCRHNGLYLTIKPGPYILAEYVNGGIPAWFVEKFPEVFSIDADGNPFPTITHIHPTFIKYTKRWFNAILKIIAGHQISAPRGNIIMMQLCNETGVDYWLRGMPNYHPLIVGEGGFYQRFLKEKYRHKIANLNKSYGTRYKTFAEVQAPGLSISCVSDYVASCDWHNFWRWYYAYYLDLILKEVRRHNITIPVFHNIPGWVYGRAHDYPLNFTMYRKVVQKNPEILLALDHIPENFNYRNAHDDFISNQIARAIHPRSNPLYIAELQSGTREACVTTYPNELALFYRTCIAHQIKGMNFYMFSQGKNPPQKGTTGKTFYWQTPLDSDANPNEFYYEIKRLGQFLGTHSQNILQADSPALLCAGFYPPYYESEYRESEFADESRIQMMPPLPDVRTRFIRNKIYFDGILQFLFSLNVPYRIEDIQTADVRTLRKYKHLWFLSLEYLDASTQRNLVNYVHNGGHLVLFNTAPRLDENLQECLILRKGLGIEEKKVLQNQTRIKFFDIDELPIALPVKVYNPDGVDAFAKTIGGECCGFTKKCGRGKLTLLGTAFGYQVPEHKAAIKKLIDSEITDTSVRIDNENLLYSLLIGKGYGYLFVANIHQTPQTCKKIIIKHKALKRDLIFPQKDLIFPRKGVLQMAPVSGAILPLNVEIPNSPLTVIYSTAEIMSIRTTQGTVTMEIYSPHSKFVEIAFSSKMVVKKAFVDGGEQRIFTDRNETIITFYTDSKETVNLDIIFLQ